MRIRAMLCMLFVLFSTALITQAQSSPPVPSGKAGPGFLSKVTKVTGLSLVLPSATPPNYNDCLQNLGIPCYSPQQIRKAYRMNSLLEAGFNGTGQTIVIIDSFGSPTIADDLKHFDAAYGIPDPPSFRVLAPLGTVPFDPTNLDQLGWAFEATLDVEWAHATAPGASIVLLTSPVSETQGVQGMPEFLALEKYALDHHLGNIISQSWSTTENNLFTPEGQQVCNDFQAFYERAAREHVTVLAASGDFGSTNPTLNPGEYFPFPTVVFPASSPLVTAVGGTTLYVDPTGNYQHETVWNNAGVTFYTGLLGNAVFGTASGGGVSQQFTEPEYQFRLSQSVQQTLNNHRGIPDVAFNADMLTPTLFYAGFFPIPALNGYYTASGTSVGTPQWAGIVAIANQFAGHPLGFLNPKLYSIAGRDDGAQSFRDITFGSNAFPFAGVAGYTATRGWDLATGWGTPKVDQLVQQLADQQ